MYSCKQIFLVLALLSVASAKKGLSLRGPPSELEDAARRGLKKGSKKGGSKGGGGFSGGSFSPPRTGDGVTPGVVDMGNGLNRDGTASNELRQPAGKPCIPVDEAERYITDEYPGDAECRPGGVSDALSTSCCRLFKFTDVGESASWLLYDANNQYPDLLCKCNGNTGDDGEDDGEDIINIPPVAAPTAGGRTGGDGDVVDIPAPATGASVCAPAQLNPTQIDLQSRPGVTPCITNAECGGDGAAKCCSVDTCICYPTSFLEPSKCIPAPVL